MLQGVDMAYNYCIFNTIELDKINFDQVIESNKDTLRFSLDNNQTFVKWNGATPDCIHSLSTGIIYNYTEILDILTNSFWLDNTGPV